jgi:3-hydroxyacyl-CoA dehydrogenase / enoyl-CoA hydratase / 3-hydroxybutyryl-CoA epimerase
MSGPRPDLEQFRIEDGRDGLIHLVFDMPGRTMNVFSNAAIHELGRFASWLKDADVRGVLIRSGKENAFCAGADLGELGVAYDMIVAAHPQDQFTTAFDHFFPLSHGIRKLETAGKPVAVALSGIALGGGCEFAMGGHYRVLVDDPRIGLGLPESLVGLLPGAGGTQRMPRLVGLPLALDILLDGKRLSGSEALKAGLVHELVSPGHEIEAAERWLLGNPTARQPWDEAGSVLASTGDVAPIIASRRQQILSETLGHYPAPLAILDCVEQGFVQPIDAAIRTEMSIFAGLIQRPEPRNMIQTLFLGKLDFEKAARKDTVPAPVNAAVQELTGLMAGFSDLPELRSAGFRTDASQSPVRTRAGRGLWLDDSTDGLAATAKARLDVVAEAAAKLRDGLSSDQQRMADYAIVQQAGFPAYLGGPFAMAAARR